MGSLKAVVVQDYSGNCVLSVLGGGVVTDLSLVSGFLSAIDSFSVKVLGGGLNYFKAGNGISFLFDSFFIDKRVKHQYLTFTYGFPFDEFLVRVSDDEYFIADDSVKGERVVFPELIPDLGFSNRSIKVVNPVNNHVHVVHYKPGIEYFVGGSGNRVSYALIYDGFDNELLRCDGSFFVKSRFNELGAVLKCCCQELGYFMDTGDISLVDSNVKPVVDRFVNSYDAESSDLRAGKFLNEAPVKLSELSGNSNLIKSIKEGLNHLNELLR